MSDVKDAILRYAGEQYGSQPEYLWKKYPGYAVLRHQGHAKWYAVMMNVEKSKLGLDGGGMVDILDVKCDKVLIGSLLDNKGFLPAYHMNKANWISVLLDGSVSTEEITLLLDMSYQLTGK